MVESEGLEQLPEYSNVLFEEDVDLLTGAVYDMSITEDYEIILDCLERDDIVPNVPTVSVVLTASSTSVTYGDTVVLTVSVSEDGVPVSGGTVSFYDGVTLLGTDTTDSSGEASLSTSSLSVGSHSLSAKYDDSTSNVVTVTVSDVPAPTPASVSLTSDKSILSYADSESATLSATVLDSGSNPLEGVTVEFFKGSTSLGTADTNSSGIATKTYASAGSGDISVSAEVDDITSNSVSIEDCIRYDNATSDKTSNYSKTNLNSLTFSTDHYEAYRSLGTSPSSTYYSPIYADDTLPSNFEMSVMYKASNMNREQTEFIISSTHPTTNSGATELGVIVSDARRGLFYRLNGSLTWYTEANTLSNNTWYTFYLKVEGTTVTGKILDENNNTVYTSTQTISAVQNYKKWSIINGANSRTLHWKELKIKTL